MQKNKELLFDILIGLLALPRKTIKTIRLVNNRTNPENKLLSNQYKVKFKFKNNHQNEAAVVKFQMQPIL